MRNIPLDSLRIPGNSTQESITDGSVDRIVRSIMADGLKFPPIVKQLPDGTYTLIAGERRARALCFLVQQQLSFLCSGEQILPGFIPVIVISDIALGSMDGSALDGSPTADGLTWKQQAAAIAELHALRTDEAVDAGRFHTAMATAAEVVKAGEVPSSVQAKYVTEAVILARHLEDTDVAEAKTQWDAIKILRKKATDQHRAKLAAEFDQAKPNHTLHHGDAFTYLRSYERSTFHCILTDPPYSVGANVFGQQSGTSHESQDTWEYSLSCYTALARQGFRICRENAVLYAFFDIKRFHTIEMEFQRAGWDVWPVPLIWAKTNGPLPLPERGPRRTYEAILMATKGSPRFFKIGEPDVIICPQREEARDAEKSVDLYTELLERSTMPGNMVLDPFAGTGTIFSAANRAKVIAHGIELSEEPYHVALTRMSETSA